MRNILGFYRIPSLSNNNVGAVATFGEINTQAMTYTTEERNFAYSTLYPNVELVTMQVVDELNQPVATTDTVMKRIVAVGEWLTGQHRVGNIPSNTGKDQFYAALKTEFSDLEWVSLGDIIRSAENSYFMPTHVEFNISDSNYEYHVKVWTASAKFQTEYEPFQIFIIPPVDSLEQFINNTVTVTNLLAATTPARVIERYNVIRGNNPETRFDTYSLVWQDPDVPESRLKTEWAYLARGVGGTSVDNIKTAIRDYLANNSTYAHWEKIFPSLYEETDFTILPLWDTIAVPATQIDQNLYSSAASLKGLVTKALNLVPTSYGTTAMVKAHIEENLELLSTPYRGMNMAVIANPSNLGSIVRISKLYPDYVNTPISDPDFERMEANTRIFCERLNEGLEKARTLKESDATPAGFYRTRRNNMTYLTFLHLDYQHMILTRESYLAKITLLGD